MRLGLSDVTNKALEELQNGTDRTIAVVSGAIVDSHLTDLLKNNFKRDDTEYSTKILNNVFQPEGPLGNFGAKIWVAYLMGYLSPIAHDDLQNLRFIRNQFAHYSQSNSFETQRIKDRCANFKLISEHIRPAAVSREPGGPLVDSVTAQHKVLLHLVDHQEALATPKSRFVNTAKLFVAALEISRPLLRKPIL